MRFFKNRNWLAVPGTLGGNKQLPASTQHAHAHESRSGWVHDGNTQDEIETMYKMRFSWVGFRRDFLLVIIAFCLGGGIALVDKTGGSFLAFVFIGAFVLARVAWRARYER